MEGTRGILLSLNKKSIIHLKLLSQKEFTMNFYFSLYQLIETVERLHQDIQHLTGRALRISPRDARANRELLENSEFKIKEVKSLLNNKAHVSKITLRKAAILFQILELSYRRVVHLAGATANVGHDDEDSIKAVWNLITLAQKHYQTLVITLYDLTGIPVMVNVSGSDENASHDLAAILQKETIYQQETLKLLEKAIEVFGEEQDLADRLSQIRKDLLESKKRLKQVPASAVPKTEFLKPSEKSPVKVNPATTVVTPVKAS